MCSNCKLFKSLIVLIIASIVFQYCKLNKDEHIPNVNNINTNFELIRFDQLLLNNQIDQILSEYPAFSKLYFEQIISITDTIENNKSALKTTIEAFLKDSIIQSIYSKVNAQYSKFDDVNTQFKSSLQFFKYYFPEKTEPIFYTFISEFGYGNFIFEDKNKRDGIGIGLDYFLGNTVDYKAIDPKNPAFSDYLTRSFNRDHLVKKTWECWVDDFIGANSGQQFIEQMIHQGKKQYILKKLLPTTSDTILFEFTDPQMKWCNANEVELWSFFMDSNLLYSVESAKFNKYINPSPNSPGMPEIAPGRTACFIGYKIIEKYMKNTNTSLLDLVKMKDSQKIVELAKYKPRNK